MGKFNCDSVDDVFLCYQEPVTTFHEIDSFREIKLEIMVLWVFVQKSRVLSCVTWHRRHSNQVSERRLTSVHPSSSLFRNAILLENVNIAPFYQH